jgi:hypothetical protein
MVGGTRQIQPSVFEWLPPVIVTIGGSSGYVIRF